MQTGAAIAPSCSPRRAFGAVDNSARLQAGGGGKCGPCQLLPGGPEGLRTMKELMYDINAGLIAALLLAIALAAIEIGFRFGRRSRGAALDDDSKAHINATQASTLGILALLLAFT